MTFCLQLGLTPTIRKRFTESIIAAELFVISKQAD